MSETDINLLEIHTTLAHVVKEMDRIGRVVDESDSKNQLDHDAIKSQLADLDKRLCLTDKDVKIQIGKVSSMVATVTAILLWLLKSGIIAAMNGGTP